MQTIDAIRSRRSIRRFKPDAIERKQIEKLLELTVQAPSAKNDQPWRFVVLEKQAKARVLGEVQAVLDRLTADSQPTGSLRGSLKAMEEAPVLILVFNGIPRTSLPEDFQYIKFLVDTQSLGAAIQTMLLAAQAMGLGTLWICDVLYATEEIKSFVQSQDELVAAVALGLPDESPVARPRSTWRDVTVFLD